MLRLLPTREKADVRVEEKRAVRRPYTSPTVAETPEMSVRGGHRRVVLTDDWCGVVRQDYTVVEKPAGDGRVKLYD